MPKRKINEKPSEEKPAPTTYSCAVCLEDEFPARQMSFFPCLHSFCDACFERCERCPICRISRSGETDEERRALAEREREIGMGDVVIARIPAVAVINFIGGSGGTPFDALTVRNATTSQNHRLHAAFEQIVQAISNTPSLTRGQRAQLISSRLHSAMTDAEETEEA